MLGVEDRNLIGGKWVAAAGGGILEVVDPATDQTIAEVPDCTAEDFASAVAAASAALSNWKHHTATERSRLLRRLCDLVEDGAEGLAHVISAESGKPLHEARAEVAYGAGFLEWASDEAKRVYGETVPASRPEQRILVLRQAIGVTAAITPWNFPLAMLTRKLGPALAVGCTQVVKPAPETPLTAIALAEMAVEVGIPPGVLNVVTGSAPDFARVIFEDARVRKVSFTGSTEVGQELVHRSAAHLPRLSLELGGHAPVIVLADADLDTAVRQSITAKFRNAGQSCIAANRFYVARDLYDGFCDAFARASASLRVGPWTEESDVGPLINEAAVQRVERHVADAVGRGAELLCGGRRRDLGPGTSSRFFEPTVVKGVEDDMLMNREETFGPVAGIAAFDSDEEAVVRANATPYGLAAYVFGRDMGRVLHVAEELDHGVVGVNDGGPSAAQAPFGGVKMSGFGREGGHFVMSEYLQTKYLSLVG